MRRHADGFGLRQAGIEENGEHRGKIALHSFAPPRQPEEEAIGQCRRDCFQPRHRPRPAHIKEKAEVKKSQQRQLAAEQKFLVLREQLQQTGGRSLQVGGNRQIFGENENRQ